ncbi:MAG TPA: type II toxin-antitoxin system HicB family antitoxin [Allosphingosinicella sp.]|nr:type II toxin-antitoxin system HicB family antitoxin [Allosphingosinicella sp.]
MTVDVRNFRVFVEPLAPHLGGGFVSYAPELKGCVSDGATPAEALDNIYDAIACWLAAARERGEALPVPMIVRQYA